MLRGVTANLMFTDLILRVFNEGICIMSGAFQPAVMARIFPRYSFTFSCTQPGQKSGEILSWGENGLKIISALMYDLIPRWHTQPVYSRVADFNMIAVLSPWVSIGQFWLVFGCYGSV